MFISSGTTATLNANITWDPRPGCRVIGVAGGGVETLAVNGYVVDNGVQWAGADLVVDMTANALMEEIRLDWFTTSAQAVAAMPVGGTLDIGYGFDVATYGVISSTKAFDIKGSGWVTNSSDTPYGSVIYNSGGDVVDSPVITFDGASSLRHINISGISIFHEGATTPAIKIENSPYTNITDIRIHGNNLGYAGIEYSEGSFFARVSKSTLTRLVAYGIYNHGTGSQYEFDENHIAGYTSGDNFVGVYTTCSGTFIRGGEIQSPGANSWVAKFYNTAAANRTGGGVFDVFVEDSGNFVEIDGLTNQFENVSIVRPRFSMGTGITGYGVKFERARSCSLINPQLSASSGGTALVYWGENSAYCSAEGGITNYATGTFSAHAGASHAINMIHGGIGMATGLTFGTGTNIRTIIDYIDELEGPMIHNGVAWDAVIASLDDDTATSFTTPTEEGIITLLVRNQPTYYGKVSYETAAGGAEASLLTASSIIEKTTGALTGTTGADAKITISAHTDGKIYIENRSGGGINFTVKFESFNNF